MYMPYDQLPDPSGKFDLQEEIGSGFCAKVYKAQDLQEDRTVAIKIQPYDEDHQRHIEEEYRVFRDYSNFPNLPNFYGAYRQRKSGSCDEIWLVMEYCEGGSAVELVNRLLKKDKKLKEEHIAFIIKEACKGIVELNRSHFIHRDIRGSNILLTKQGEVKLCDFGLTREVDSTIGKLGTCIGSPCWMAPELVNSQNLRGDENYDSRVDVWALGITTIELSDGKPPFFDMHPTRAMFQIVRNPPPTLFKPTNWSQNLNDFISECLEKNPENRPMMVEIIEHPFLNENTENENQLQNEIKHFIDMAKDVTYNKPEEISVERGYIKKLDSHPEKMYSEDLAAIENPMDDIILETLHKRLNRGTTYAFIGDVLLSLNSNDMPEEHSEDFHSKYKFKSRSENAPHIFTTADVAYQDMMHHKEPQHVIFSGESYSGKSTNLRMFVDHLCFLGGGNKGATDRVKNSMKIINLLCSAGTPLNNDSTRCCLQYHITFGTTGKMSGAVFLMYFLEKSRISTTDMNQHNFHAIYCFYDFIVHKGKAGDYFLDKERNYRYMRIPSEKQTSSLKYCRDDPKGNVSKYEQFEKILNDLDMSNKNLETVRRILAAILHIGNIRFKQNDKGCEIDDKNVVTKVSDLLRVDEKKFLWSLTQYIKVKGGIAERYQYTAEEARTNRDSFSANLYSRLVDWIINKINMNLSFPRAVFGDANCIIGYDMFGFECFPRNNIEQLMINTLNEQMQYHYNQKTFASEMFEMEADEIPAVKLTYYDNKQILDHLLTKPDGLFYKIDDATRDNKDTDAILESVSDKRSNFIKSHGNSEINVSHYTGKINYDARGFIEANKDFMPPELIESMRTSLDESIVLMFTNQLTKCGNLTMAFENVEHKQNDKLRRTYYVMNTLSQGQFSQGTVLRTLSSVFRSVCLDLLKTLSSGIQAGTHFVRCIRADLEFKPKNFHSEMVRQQMKALGILDTVIGRQQGYSCRISFQEFLRRYQFLAFDFDENVDVTKDNCRLLLVRLKMEGWAIGKSKVFLRYYNDEFLSRLYETQVKKIVKVQSMMRAFISRRKVAERANPGLSAQRHLNRTNSTSEAAITIQKAYRGFKVRQKYGPLLNERTGVLDKNTAEFLKGFTRKWKAKSLYQVLLYYRAAKFQDFVNLSQQVHLYNQRVVANLHVCGRPVSMDKIDTRQNNISIFGPIPLPIRKIPFKLNDIPFFDTSYMCDPVNPLARVPMATNPDEEEWDAPFQKSPSLTAYLMTYNAFKKDEGCQTNWDKMHESENVYNQSYVRDSNSMRKRSDSESSNYYDHYNNENNNNYGNQQSYYQNKGNKSGFNSGSRRNSLKNHRAPAPPTISMKNSETSTWVRGNDNSWRRPTENYGQNRDFKPPNPVRELEMLGKRANMDNDDDAPPFNFRSMLRKTKHENNNYEYNSRDNNGSSNNYLQPKLRSTGMNKYENNNDDRSYRKASVASSADSNYRGTYIEEEIAPGVTLSGYAIDI